MVPVRAGLSIRPRARAGSREDRARVDARTRSRGRTRWLVPLLARGTRVPRRRDPSSRARRSRRLAPDLLQGSDEWARVVPDRPLPGPRRTRRRRVSRRLQPRLQPGVRVLTPLQLSGATARESTRRSDPRRRDDSPVLAPRPAINRKGALHLGLARSLGRLVSAL